MPNSPRIHFFKEDIKFRLPPLAHTRAWLTRVAKSEGFKIQSLNIIFCSDPYLRNINKNFLAHDYFTDVVTFEYSERELFVEGDIFVSIDRIRDNAIRLNQPFFIELNRVIVHGLLHLLGYSDKETTGQKIMREKENHYLSLRKYR
jgi:probable rRNA maturation factor